MADVSSLTDKVSERARYLFDEAVAGFADRLDRVVPIGEVDVLGRGRVGPKLRDTFFRNPTRTTGMMYSADIGYTAPQAFYSNNLMPPHPIPLRRLPYPLRFWSNLEGAEIRTMKVNHPGNVNADSLGWWDKQLTPVSWRNELEASQ
jgi:hypothetical protein